MSFVTPVIDVDERYRALIDVAGALTSASQLDDLLLSLRRHLDSIVAFTFLAVSLRDHETDALVLRFFDPQDHPASGLVGSRYPIDGTYPGEAARSGRPVYIPRVEPDGPYPSALLAE